MQLPYETTFEIIGNEIPTAFIFKKCIDKQLHEDLLDLTDDESFYNDEVTVTVSYFEQYFPQIMAKVEAGNERLVQLAFILSDCFKQKIQQYECMKEEGKITFDHLSRMFTIGTKFVAVGKESQLVGSVVHSTQLRTGMMGEKYFIISGIFTFSIGLSFSQAYEEFAIEEFKGLRYPENLNCRLMTPTDFAYLTERGRKFYKYAKGINYCAYKGSMFYKTMYGNVHFEASGRVMIDKIGYKTINPNDKDKVDVGTSQTFDEIPEELLYLTWPFVKGFSINAKRWGEIFVDNLCEIEFDDNAFDYLVLDPKRKAIAKSLVVNSKGSFGDIIKGKSGGCIFLLHGPPGTGKTLTCEAISELLHQPLYSITVGELGTTPDVLEKKLSQILEITKSWNAVILIDEADVFLEKRSENDLQRNAMVGIFLRLLERHTGVMFLTTNRADQLDEAFKSRISVIFKYDALNFEMRSQIWKNLLIASSCVLSPENIEYLSQYEINGRQIKNAIRMAQSLALGNSAQINIEYLIDVIELMDPPPITKSIDKAINESPNEYIVDFSNESIVDFPNESIIESPNEFVSKSIDLLLDFASELMNPRQTTQSIDEYVVESPNEFVGRSIAELHNNLDTRRKRLMAHRSKLFCQNT